MISSTLGFFILNGSFANSGLIGMWDLTYLNILINTPTGQIQIIRSISFALLLIIMLVKLSRRKMEVSITESTIFIILLTPILFSFSTRSCG